MREREGEGRGGARKRLAICTRGKKILRGKNSGFVRGLASWLGDPWNRNSCLKDSLCGCTLVPQYLVNINSTHVNINMRVVQGERATSLAEQKLNFPRLFRAAQNLSYFHRKRNSSLISTRVSDKLAKRFGR